MQGSPPHPFARLHRRAWTWLCVFTTAPELEFVLSSKWSSNQCSFSLLAERSICF
jgi:hypothetical protein